MHVVIMGCGRVGSALAHSLEDRGHSVAVIDRKAEAFRRLGSQFTGRRVIGTGYDRDTLLQAGVEQASAFAAVSSGDNSNILAARIVRETFGVDHVVARIYDPRRAEVYTRLGIPTVATARWTADQMLRRLLPEGAANVWSDATGSVVLAQISYASGWVAHSVKRIDELTGARVAVVSRFGESSIAGPDTIIQDGDVLHLLVPRPNLTAVEAMLASPPPPA